MTTEPGDPPPDPSPDPRRHRPAAGPQYPDPHIPGPAGQGTPEYPAAPGRPGPQYPGPQYPGPQDAGPAPGLPGRRSGGPPAPRGPAGPPGDWKTRHSLWLLLPLVNLGWVGFVVIGRAGRNRTWLRWALGYGVFWLFALILDNAHAAGADVVMTLGYLAPLVHGAIVNREVLRRMWARRTGLPLSGNTSPEPELTAPPTRPDDPPTRLAAREATTVRLARGPRFPLAGTRVVLAIGATLRPVLDEQRAGRLTEAQAEQLEQIVVEYLPHVVEGFLRLPDAYLDEGDRRARLTAQLDAQLDALAAAARTLQTSVFSDDADEFEANGRFLREKFGRSSLDLGPS